MTSPHTSTAIRLTNPTTQKGDHADAVYLFDREEEARSFAKLCEGWRKRRVLRRTVKAGGCRFDKFTVCLWSHR